MNCVLGEYTFLTECNVTCGSGYQLYGQPILIEARDGGTCNRNLQELTCYVKDPCPCIKEWSPWSPCSSPCGAGLRSRNETVIKEADIGGECPNLPGNANEVCVGEGEDCPLSASMIGLISGLVLCFILMSVFIVLYIYRRTRARQVIVKPIPVPVPLEDYQYDNNNWSVEEKTTDDHIQSPTAVPHPVAHTPDYSPYAEGNVDDDHQEENYNRLGIYYTSFDEVQ